MSIRPSFRSARTFQPAGEFTEKPIGSLCVTHCPVAGAETVLSGALAAADTLAGARGAGWTSGFFTDAEGLAAGFAGGRLSGVFSTASFSGASAGVVCGAATSIIARMTRSLTEAVFSSMS